MSAEAAAPLVEPMMESPIIHKAAWFYHLELALLAEGGYHLSLAATTVDEEEPQLLYQELIDERVANIDEGTHQAEAHFNACPLTACGGGSAQACHSLPPCNGHRVQS